MASRKKQILEEMVKNTELIISTVIEGSETNGSNLMEVYIEYEEE